jgi:hypothetical protein
MSQSKPPARSSRKNRRPVSLNQRLDHKLFAYTVAASAAGVGIMGLAQPGLAEIVYTPTHQRIPSGRSVTIDLNHDGTTDFTISNSRNSCTTGPGCIFQVLRVSPNGLGRVVTTFGRQFFARPLPAGERVGAGDDFNSFSYAPMDRCKATRESYYLSGSWVNEGTGYLGLEFSIDGQVHYGWARLSVSGEGGLCLASALLTGYAYETEPKTPIETGRTSGTDDRSQIVHPAATLGMLALGSVRLEPWRRDEDPVEQPDTAQP